MNILADVHGYPPGLNAGAEKYLQAVLEYAVKRGHSAQVAVGFEQRIEAIDTHSSHPYDLDTAYNWADVVLTHLDRTNEVVKRIKKAKDTGTPLVPLIHFVHNEEQLVFHKVTQEESDLVVFNSNATRRRMEVWNGLSMVLHPPIWPADYRVKTSREFVTLINLNENKGGKLLIDIARRLPNVKFLAVKGGYDDQKVPNNLHNVEVWKNQTDIRKVYSRTAILLVPSRYESYGRVALEAASSGIPVIAYPTDGLHEAMGDAATWIPYRVPAKWTRPISRLLNDSGKYHEMSVKAKRRADSLNANRDLNRFLSVLQMITR